MEFQKERSIHPKMIVAQFRKTDVMRPIRSTDTSSPKLAKRGVLPALVLGHEMGLGEPEAP